MVSKRWASFLVCAVMCCANSGWSASREGIGGEWIGKLEEIFRDDKPYVPTDNPDLVRETKFPGEIYNHHFISDLTGIGRAITKRGFSWFDSKKTIRFQHHTDVLIMERITSSQDELAQGIVKSKFTVNRFSESLGSVNGKLEIGALDSSDVAKLLVELGRTHGDKFKKGTLLAALAALFPSISTKIAAAGAATSWAFGWFIKDYLPNKVDKEGYAKLNREDVEKRFPGYKDIVVKIRKIEGSTVDAVWEVGKGYTSIKINPSPEVEEKDCEWLAKVIYRMNPVGARSVLPKGKEGKDFWTVDVSDIGGLIIPAGTNYDTLRGAVTLRNKGIAPKEFKDEQELDRKTVPVYCLGIADEPGFGNKIFFCKKFKDGSALRLTVVPRGKIEVAVDEDKPGAAPVYVRYLEFRGKLSGRLDKTGDGFWREMQVEETSTELTCQYTQLRQRR